MALPSPGNKYCASAEPMRIPSLDHLFRLQVDMCSPSDRLIIPGPQGLPTARLVMPILGGKLFGPNITGAITSSAGADWATNIGGTDFSRLDARYNIKTDDGHYLFIRSSGTFSLPGLKAPSGTSIPSTITQDVGEWFTHITIEAPGDSPYNYLNSVLAVGCLSQTDDVIYIDTYRLTNFPDAPPRSIVIPQPSAKI